MTKTTTIISLITLILFASTFYPLFMYYLAINKYLFNKLDLLFTLPMLLIFIICIISLLHSHLMLIKDINCINSLDFKKIKNRSDLLESINHLGKCSLSNRLQSLFYLNKSSSISSTEISNHISDYIMHRGDGLKFPIGALILLGLLGTFMGLIISLKNIVWMFEGSNIISKLSISFEGIALAFGTSICGIFSSILLRFFLYLFMFNSHKLYTYIRIKSFRHIESLIVVTPHDLLSAIFTESFNRMIAEVMKDILQETNHIVKNIYKSSLFIENNMKQHTQIINSLSNSTSNIENVSNGLSEMLNSTFLSISKNAEFTSQISEYLNNYKTIIDDMKILMNKNIESFSRESSLISSTVKTVVEQHTGKIELFTKELDKNKEQYNEYSKYYSQSISKLDELFVQINNNNSEFKEFYNKSVTSLNILSESSKEYVQKKEVILEYQKEIIIETNRIINEFSKNLDYLSRVITRKDKKYLMFLDDVTNKLKPFIPFVNQRAANIKKTSNSEKPSVKERVKNTLKNLLKSSFDKTNG